MILDLQRFLAQERPYWNELDEMLTRMRERAGTGIRLDEIQRLYYLYRRTASDLARVRSQVAETELQDYLETLVARAYGEIHEVRSTRRIRPIHFIRVVFPNTVRQYNRALLLSCIVFGTGALCGAFLTVLDDTNKSYIVPSGFAHVLQNPSDRVAEEEAARLDHLAGNRTLFSTELMTHNIRISIMAVSVGFFWGMGTFLLLFYNGTILGLVFADFIQAGESFFVFGWLLPHGIIEIPAILIAGQAGLLLGGAVLGYGNRNSLSLRLRHIAPVLIILITGVALMLIWAGIIEAFLSQYHEPFIPYSLKILFGIAEGIIFLIYLVFSGRKADKKPNEVQPGIEGMVY